MSAMLSFEASCITVDHDEDRLVVGLADDASAPERYLLLQLALDPDEQDRELGLDDVHLEVDDQSRSVYGGIASCTLTRDRLELRLDERAAGEVGAFCVRVALDLDADRYSTLRDGLRRLFRDRPGVLTEP